MPRKKELTEGETVTTQTWLEAWRLANHLSSYELALQLGIKRSALVCWERGSVPPENTPNHRRLLQFGLKHGLSVKDLLTTAFASKGKVLTAAEVLAAGEGVEG